MTPIETLGFWGRRQTRAVKWLLNNRSGRNHGSVSDHRDHVAGLERPTTISTKGRTSFTATFIPLYLQLSY